MNAKKFVAATSRDALRMVRDDLGPDAVILSNRKVDAGVEIVALAGSELSALTEMRTQQAAPAPAPKKVMSGTQQLLASYTARIPDAAPVAPMAPQPVRMTASAVPIAPVQDQQGALMSEIKSMRNMLQEQLACIGWSEMQQRSPERTKLLRELLNAGFSATLARHLLEKLPDDAGPSWIRKVVEHNLRVIKQEDSLVTRGGVYALVGPTGVGKTTTTAKLAARAVVRYGANKVALISSDSYRIGAHEQLSIYAKMLGVSVHSVHDVAELKRTLAALRDKHLVLIDTIGMGQRDGRVASQTQMYDSCGVKRLLLLNATSGGDTLEEVVRKYRTVGVVGCIPTKLDEAVSLGTVLDVAVRHQIPLHYIANGQRVPEDLHEVNVDYLLHRAFKPAAQSAPFALNELEMPALMSGQGVAPAASRRLAA
ncbi:Flagellar biosynthesis protein FlhF [Ferriphaselus amnicola]|uniref:Flagellar biosynthesis protein FlhF n=1 Tax=Ferriphaselus amnicola TaxID=1188319 RepID=A0A2Z6GDA0_9PROT|nr:flagellar biosynthesis protein FlhF [Ferriphaselus amnicola]BBE51498.1 Flagellar biosynthesis protein FlhF [Ferriphaselus amnicola]